MTWPPPYPSPYYNLTKKDQAEYDAVVERDGDGCIECGGAWETHHVRFGAEVKRVVDRNNMILLCKHHHDEAHAHKEAKQQEYLKYLAESPVGEEA